MLIIYIMNNLIILENETRDQIIDEYHEYIKLFENYNEDLISIIKYLFINIHSANKIVEGRPDKDSNKFMKKMFDRVYVMNGISEIMRCHEMKEKLLLNDITFEFFDTYEKESPECYIKYLDYDMKESIQYEEWCHLMTLRELFEKSINQNHKKTFVLSNNAYLNCQFYNKIKYNKELYKKWDVVIFDSDEIELNIKDILDTKKSFATTNYSSRILLNYIDTILNTGKREDIQCKLVIVQINNIINSNITWKNIEVYRQNEEKKYNTTMINIMYKKKLIDEKENSPEKQNKISDINKIITKLRGGRYMNYYIYPITIGTFLLTLNYNNLMENSKNYYHYLENKKVALIGPSPSIRKTKNGEEIDNNYDVIIKMNNAIYYNSEPEYYGKRIDVLYTLSLAQDIKQHKFDSKYINFQEFFFDKIKDLNIKYLYFSLGLYNLCKDDHTSIKICKMSEMYNIHNVPILFMNSEIVQKHIDACNKIPSAGFGAIMDLIKRNTKELFIKGFSFFKDGHTNAYISQEWKNKVDKSNKKTKENMTEETKEKVIHSLVQNSFVYLTPHHFDYEYECTIGYYKNNTNIVFDDSIKELYE